MDKDCKNMGSSWCADFECVDCPVRDTEQKQMDNTLRGQIAREVGQHAENCPYEDCTASEKDSSIRSAEFILSLFKTYLEGIELTDEEMVEAVNKYGFNYGTYVPRGTIISKAQIAKAKEGLG